jgi:distribution and morphology protein 31
VKRLSDFDGSWTVFDCGLVNNVSREVYRAFVSDIGDRKHRNRRLRKVTLWAASVAAQALFIGLAGQLA